jgi:hypothetical protein
VYIAGDNVLRIPASLIATQNLNTYINSTQVFNLRFGLNFVWGRNRSFDKRPKGTDEDPDYRKVREKTK